MRPRLTPPLPQAGGIGSEGLTYAERQTLGYGTSRERLGKARAPRALRRCAVAPLRLNEALAPAQDSIKDFDACALCLQPVQARPRPRRCFARAPTLSERPRARRTRW